MPSPPGSWRRRRYPISVLTGLGVQEVAAAELVMKRAAAIGKEFGNFLPPESVS